MIKLKKPLSITLSLCIMLSVAAESIATGYAETVLPEKYSSVEQGYITPVKNQNGYGTCWAHGIIAACEASLIKNNGFSSDIDLSELNLAYAAKHTMYDRLGLFNQYEDNFIQDYMKDGGNPEDSALAFTNWNGPVFDTFHNGQFSSEKYRLNGLDHLDFASKELLYCNDAAHLTDYYVVNTADIETIKENIMKYGAGTITLQSANEYVDNEKGIWFYNEEMPYEAENAHLMCIVGWDDTIPADELSVNGYTPSQNGAFIVKNSWGTESGNEGYYYVPYEEYMLNNNGGTDFESYFFSFEGNDNYTYNYGYDDSSRLNDFTDFENPNSISAGNIFTAVSDDEELEAVAFFPMNDEVSYEIKVYTGIPENPANPECGTLRLTTSGATKQKGYRTVKLPESVKLSKGERFSVVITLNTAGDDNVMLATNAKTVNKGKYAESDISWIHTVSEGWTNVVEMDPGCVARIKAFTSSPSTPALTEPDDYNSYNGKNKAELLEKAASLRKEFESIYYDLNYNSNDVSRLMGYLGLFYSINTNPDMFTASELYATLNDYEKLLKEIRKIEPYDLLDDYSFQANMLISRSSRFESIPQFKIFENDCKEIEEIINNNGINKDNYFIYREKLSKSFFDLLYYVIEHGAESSGLQLMGDVNNDGIVSVSDVTCIQRNLAGFDEVYPFSSITSKVSANYEVTLDDAVLIQKQIAGIIDVFPFYEDDLEIDDGYNADMSKDELINYLESELDKRSAWEEYTPSLMESFESFRSNVIYENTKKFLETAENMPNELILFRVRNLINEVDTEPFYE